MTQIIIRPHSDTQRYIQSLETQLRHLREKRFQEQELVAAATELVAAEGAADEVAHQWVSETATDTVAGRLAMIDRLARARRKMGELTRRKAT